MKIKKTGFTLIELLAIIAILAIILLIAVPKIIDVMEAAKRESFRESATLGENVFEAITPTYLR